jgi:hypothetical protein
MVIDRKVKAGTLTSALSGLVLWLLVSFVPAFHHGVPIPVADAIPVAVSVVSGFVAAYSTKHKIPVERILSDAEKDLEPLVEHVIEQRLALGDGVVKHGISATPEFLPMLPNTYIHDDPPSVPGCAPQPPVRPLTPEEASLQQDRLGGAQPREGLNG